MTDEQATAQAGREAFEKSPDSVFVREMKAVMRLYQQARAEGVLREDAERGIELVLRAQWTKPPTKFPDDRDLCDDTGWRERMRTHEMRCTRLNRARLTIARCIRPSSITTSFPAIVGRGSASEADADRRRCHRRRRANGQKETRIPRGQANDAPVGRAGRTRSDAAMSPEDFGDAPDDAAFRRACDALYAETDEQEIIIMTEPTHPIAGGDMTDAEIKYAIEEYVTAKWNILEAEFKDIKQGIEDAIAAATAGSLQAGDSRDSVVQRADLFAVDGGPTAPISRSSSSPRNPDDRAA